MGFRVWGFWVSGFVVVKLWVVSGFIVSRLWVDSGFIGWWMRRACGKRGGGPRLVWSLGFRVLGAGFRVQGAGCKVSEF